MGHTHTHTLSSTSRTMPGRGETRGKWCAHTGSVVAWLCHSRLRSHGQPQVACRRFYILPIQQRRYPLHSLHAQIQAQVSFFFFFFFFFCIGEALVANATSKRVLDEAMVYSEAQLSSWDQTCSRCPQTAVDLSVFRQLNHT
ncbi:hypothetical protein LX36DRAFT_24439 [Colletotrichum falcatum]|nr:hypothetical protein LX36DRAFT_24439 [Colletotrichum falcatum]